jgi:small multidrug resistance family-3 protein
MTTDTGLGAVARSVCIFIAAGVCEIGGGYLVWRWWREGAGWPAGLLGSLILVLYGIIPTFQAAPFGRVYAAYGAVFVVMSLGWARVADGFAPDRFDLIGAALCLAGVGLIMYAPR